MGGIEVAPQELLNRIESLGVETPDGPSTTAKTDFEHQFNLNSVAIGLGLEQVFYEPESFPGIVYTPSEFEETVVLFFGGGTVYLDCAGGNGVHEVIEQMADQLTELGMLEEAQPASSNLELAPMSVQVPEEYEEIADEADTTAEDDGLESGTASEPSDVSCTNCGHDLTGDENFCPECGTELEANCPDCGYELDGSENYCPDCGTDVAGD